MKTEKKRSVSNTDKDKEKILKFSTKKKKKTSKSESRKLAKLMSKKLDLSDTSMTAKQSRSTSKSESRNLAKLMHKKLDLSDSTVEKKQSISKSEREKLAELFGPKIALSSPKPKAEIQGHVETSTDPVYGEKNEVVIEQKKKTGKKKSKRKKNKENSTPDVRIPRKKALSKEEPELQEDEEMNDEEERRDEMAGFCPPPGIVHESLMIKKYRESTKGEPDMDEEEGKQKQGKLKRDTSKDHRTVFVGNLPVTTDKKELHKLFKKFGAIETVRLRCVPRSNTKLPKRAAVILKDFHPERDNICAYVCFTEEDSARKALKMNGQLVKSLHIRVDLSNHNPKEDFKRSIFVGNLPLDIKEEDLRTHFSSCGKVRNVRVIRDNKSGVGKGICYVTFKSKDSVSLAMKLKGTEVSGRKVRIEYCLENPRKEKKIKKEIMKPPRKGNRSHKPEKKRVFHTRPSNVKSGAVFQTKIRSKQKKKKRSR